MLSLESLPDELWLLIFDHLPSKEVFRAFDHLNHRLDALISTRDVRLRIRNSRLELDRSPIFAHQVDALLIDDHQQQIDISPLIHLTSLRLNRATDEQVKLIRERRFASLRYLTIVVSPPDHRFDQILFGPSPLEYLERCWIPSLTLPQVNQPCLTLRSLRLNFATMDTCSRLLTLLPNLRRLETAIDSASILVQHTAEHYFLKSLKISLKKNVKLIAFQPILARLSALEKLHLSIYQLKVDEEQFNHDELIDLLAAQLNRLKKCHVQLHLSSGILKRNLGSFK